MIEEEVYIRNEGFKKFLFDPWIIEKLTNEAQEQFAFVGTVRSTERESSMYAAQKQDNLIPS